MLETIAQIIGIFAAAMNILSFQFKDKKKIIFMQLCGATLFTANFFMLGAVTGGLMNAIAIVRAVTYINKDKLKINDKLLMGIFFALFITSYALTFTVFGTEPTLKNFIVESLPVIAMSAVTVSFSMKNATAIRMLGITLHSPLWLTYNVFVFSIGGILCEAFSLASLAIGIIRYDIRRKPKTEKQD